jgi:hypothetical protein
MIAIVSRFLGRMREPVNGLQIQRREQFGRPSEGLCPLAEQAHRSLEPLRPGRGRDDPQRLLQPSGPRCRMKRSGRKACLNDDHRVGEGDEDAISGEK